MLSLDLKTPITIKEAVVSITSRPLGSLVLSFQNSIVGLKHPDTLTSSTHLGNLSLVRREGYLQLAFGGVNLRRRA